MTPRLVTVFGSLHYDILVDAPDRPRKGETVAGIGWRPKCGGKGGNQAVAAARAGASTAMIGAIGNDDFGRALLANLDRAGVDRRFVSTRHGVGSGMSVAIFDATGDYGAVIVSGSNLALGEDDLDVAGEIIAATGVLLLQNEIAESANISAARRFRAAGSTVVLNAAPVRALSDDLSGLVDVLVVNAVEAEMLAGFAQVDTLDCAVAAASALAGRFAAVIVTAGGEGVACAFRSGEALAVPGISVTVQSTHGAGDAFVGVLAAKIARGWPMAEALDAANRAAATLVATPEDRRG